jgi:predicted metal-dependent hydrolase
MKIKIKNPDLEYHVIYRKVKYARLEIKNGDIRLIMPDGTLNHEDIIRKNQEWIRKKLSRREEQRKEAQKRMMNYDRSLEEFKVLVFSYMEKKLKEMSLKVNKVRFRRMKSRWGSCSAEGNISINTLLQYLPKELIEYVVFHELAHILERKHNKNFWNIIAQEFPDYKEWEDELALYWLRVKDIQ